MRTVSIFKTVITAPSVRPRDLDFDGVSELEIVREAGTASFCVPSGRPGARCAADRADPDFYGGA